MAVCPVCQAEIEITPQYHGALFTCPQCSGVFFVDWSGQPEEGAPSNYSMEASTPESAEVPFPPAPYFEETTLRGEEPQEESQEEPQDKDPSDLSEIADFGNADLAIAAFNYTLIISGIDSGKIRTQVQEAITDEKFGWNVMQVMAQIKDGVLTIKSLNPVKASILMQRVKYLPVKVSWRQDVLSSTV